jgi:hypothetical protein
MKLLPMWACLPMAKMVNGIVTTVNASSIYHGFASLGSLSSASTSQCHKKILNISFYLEMLCAISSQGSCTIKLVITIKNSASE